MSGSWLGLPHFSAAFSAAVFSFLFSLSVAGGFESGAALFPSFSSQAARATSSALAALKNAIVLPSGDHFGPAAPFAILVNGHASPPFVGRMKICGGSGLPSFSIDRVNARDFPSGDQRGELSCLPDVNARTEPPAVEATQMDVSYPVFLSSTVTRTNATCEPSGEICGSPIH